MKMNSHTAYLRSISIKFSGYVIISFDGLNFVNSLFSEKNATIVLTFVEISPHKVEWRVMFLNS